MRRSSLLFLIPLIGTAIWADAAEAPELPYAYQRPIQAEAPEADLYRFRLPAEVFATLTRPDLGDLRVLDAEDQAQPMAIRTPRTGGPPSMRSVDLTVFPMARIRREPQRRFSMEVAPGEEGQSLALQLVPGEEREIEENTGTDYVLLDARRAPGYIHHLKIQWPQDAPTFQGRVALATSEELDDWQPVAEPQMLAHVRDGEHRVTIDEILVDSEVGPFLRMGWPEDAASTEPMRVTAYLEAAAQSPDLDWREIGGEADDGVYRYHSGGRFPVEKLRLDLQPDRITEVRVLSAPTADPEAWQERATGRVYALELDGERFESAPLVLAEAVTDPYWRIEADTELAPEGVAPEVAFGWRDRELLFVPRGEPPFRLVYGSATVRSRWMSVEDLTEGQPLETLAVSDVALGEPSELAGKSVLSIEEERTWRTWLLGLFGLIAVGIALFLFRRR